MRVALTGNVKTAWVLITAIFLMLGKEGYAWTECPVPTPPDPTLDQNTIYAPRGYGCEGAYTGSFELEGSGMILLSARVFHRGLSPTPAFPTDIEVMVIFPKQKAIDQAFGRISSPGTRYRTSLTLLDLSGQTHYRLDRQGILGNDNTLEWRYGKRLPFPDKLNETYIFKRLYHSEKAKYQSSLGGVVRITGPGWDSPEFIVPVMMSHPGTQDDSTMTEGIFMDNEQYQFVFNTVANTKILKYVIERNRRNGPSKTTWIWSCPPNLADCVDNRYIHTRAGTEGNSIISLSVPPTAFKYKSLYNLVVSYRSGNANEQTYRVFFYHRKFACRALHACGN